MIKTTFFGFRCDITNICVTLYMSLSDEPWIQVYRLPFEKGVQTTIYGMYGASITFLHTLVMAVAYNHTKENIAAELAAKNKD